MYSIENFFLLKFICGLCKLRIITVKVTYFLVSFSTNIGTQCMIFCNAATSTAVFPPRKLYTEQMFVKVRMQLRNHSHTTSEAFQVAKALCDIYTIFNLECCKCARMRFHCDNGLVVLRSCAPQRGHWYSCMQMQTMRFVAHLRGDIGPQRGHWSPQ